LTAKWKYDSAKKICEITVSQAQDFIFQFPLQVAIRSNNQTLLKTIAVNKRTTSVTIPINFKVESILLDPNVNLLFQGNIEEEN
jgi:hypothetical protein